MRWLAGDDATTTRGLLEATTHTEAVGTIVGRTVVLPLNRQALGPSAGPSTLLFSPPGFGNQPISRSTVARPELWLADYRLACQLGGTDDDLLIIHNLPLFLSDSARAWLEHLPPL